MSTVAVHLDRLLEPLADCLSVEVAAKVASLRADEATQSRIDYLADRSNEGLLAVEEREEYAGYVHAIDVIAVLQAKARSIVRMTSVMHSSNNSSPFAVTQQETVADHLE